MLHTSLHTISQRISINFNILYLLLDLFIITHYTITITQSPNLIYLLYYTSLTLYKSRWYSFYSDIEVEYLQRTWLALRASTCWLSSRFPCSKETNKRCSVPLVSPITSCSNVFPYSFWYSLRIAANSSLFREQRISIRIFSFVPRPWKVFF